MKNLMVQDGFRPLGNGIFGRAESQAVTTLVDSDKRIIRSVISTNQPDRAGDIIIPQGILNREQYLKNPVVLWAHQRTMPPIGVCQKLEIEKDQIIAETRFSNTSPLAHDLFQLYAEGILRGWSIGFIPRKARAVSPRSNGSSYRRPGGLQVDEWELLEYSAVPIPENPEALTVAIRKGLIEDARLRSWLMQPQPDILHDLIQHP